jgi:hypothetical protein
MQWDSPTHPARARLRGRRSRGGRMGPPTAPENHGARRPWRISTCSGTCGGCMRVRKLRILQCVRCDRCAARSVAFLFDVF